MKIAVYCPVKNELKHVEAWYDSCRAADYICVLDTGSTDGTLEKMIGLGKIRITQAQILPWRFDDAFNMAMYTVPADADICIRLDLDERLQPGWREGLLKAWTSTTTRLRYPYIWNWNPDGTPGRQWYSDRIHARVGYRWVGPTHEYLMCRTVEKQTWTDLVRIHQYPDPKQKNDLSLLKEFVHEYPHDSRAWAYLGREYVYQHDRENAIETYKKFLEISTDSIERGQALIYLSTVDTDNTEKLLLRAIKEIPDHREPLVHLADLHYRHHNWIECLNYAEKALKIVKHPMTYISTGEAWGSKPYDLAAIACWNLEKWQEAYEYGLEAVKKDSNDPRLLQNLNYFFQKLTGGART